MAIINGTNGNDTIRTEAAGGSLGGLPDATDQGDTINALAGDDIIIAGSGDDTIDAGDGDDHIEAGAGFNQIHAGDGNDTVLGGAGYNVIFPGLGSNRIDGSGGGHDLVVYTFLDAGMNVDLQAQTAFKFADGTTDTLIGLEELVATRFADTLKGSDADDYLWGDAGDDTLEGRAGNDTLEGDAGDDTLDGGTGNDGMLGAEGNDTIDGGDGDDVLIGQAGADTMRGGPGDDRYLTFSAGELAGDVIEELPFEGNDVIELDDFGGGVITFDLTALNLANIEMVRVIPFAAVIVTMAASQFQALDSLTAESPYSSLTLSGSGTFDFSTKTTNIFKFDLADGDDVATGPTAGATINGNGGTDLLQGGAGNDALDGGEGNDTLNGGDAGRDQLAGGNGDDTYIFAGDFGADTVDETTTDGLDTLAFLDLAGPDDLIVTLSAAFITLAAAGTMNSVALRRDATGETGIEQVRIGDGDPVALATLLPAVTDEPEFLFSQDGGGLPLGTVQTPPPADAALVARLVSQGVATVAGTTYTLLENTGVWNAIKGVALDPTTWPAGEGGALAIANFVDVRADLSSAGEGDLDVKVIGAKRGSLETSDGDDTLSWIFHSNEGSWNNTATIDTGAGNDAITLDDVAGSTLDDALLADNGFGSNGTQWRPGYDGRFSKAQVEAGLGDDVILVSAATHVALIANGGAGNDMIAGGRGADLLTGGADNDLLTGGLGADQFGFDNADGTELITDFYALQGDKVVILGGTASDVAIAGSGFTFGTTSVTATNGHVFSSTDFVFA